MTNFDGTQSKTSQIIDTNLRLVLQIWRTYRHGHDKQILKKICILDHPSMGFPRSKLYKMSVELQNNGAVADYEADFSKPWI